MANIRQVNKGAKVKQYTGASIKRINMADDNSIVTDMIQNDSITLPKLSEDVRDLLVGMVLPFASAVAPDGFLPCNGAAISRTAYAELFTRVGTTWGVGDGSTTFNLPDFRGMFLRGAGTHGTQAKAAGGNFDGGSVGNYVEDKMQGHYHQVTKGTASGTTVATSVVGAGYGGGTTAYDLARTNVSDGSNGTPRAGNETKPASYSVLYCIKY